MIMDSWTQQEEAARKSQDYQEWFHDQRQQPGHDDTLPEPATEVILSDVDLRAIFEEEYLKPAGITLKEYEQGWKEHYERWDKE